VIKQSKYKKVSNKNFVIAAAGTGERQTDFLLTCSRSYEKRENLSG